MIQFSKHPSPKGCVDGQWTNSDAPKPTKLILCGNIFLYFQEDSPEYDGDEKTSALATIALAILDVR